MGRARGNSETMDYRTDNIPADVISKLRRQVEGLELDGRISGQVEIGEDFISTSKIYDLEAIFSELNDDRWYCSDVVQAAESRARAARSAAYDAANPIEPLFSTPGEIIRGLVMAAMLGAMGWGMVEKFSEGGGFGGMLKRLASISESAND